jgi:hypothetical protein
MVYNTINWIFMMFVHLAMVSDRQIFNDEEQKIKITVSLFSVLRTPTPSGIEGALLLALRSFPNVLSKTSYQM